MKVALRMALLSALLAAAALPAPAHAHALAPARTASRVEARTFEIPFFDYFSGMFRTMRKGVTSLFAEETAPPKRKTNKPTNKVSDIKTGSASSVVGDDSISPDSSSDEDLVDWWGDDEDDYNDFSTAEYIKPDKKKGTVPPSKVPASSGAVNFIIPSPYNSSQTLTINIDQLTKTTVLNIPTSTPKTYIEPRVPTTLRPKTKPSSRKPSPSTPRPKKTNLPAKTNSTKRPVKQAPISVAPVKKNKVTKVTNDKNCNNKRKPVASAVKPAAVTVAPAVLHTPTPVPSNAAAGSFLSSIFNFFRDDDEDDNENLVEVDPATSYASWLGSFFTKTATKEPIDIMQLAKPAPTTPRPSKVPGGSWFGSFLMFEEDDSTFSNTSATAGNKKTQKKNYNGYQLLRMYPDSTWKIQEMRELQEDSQGSGLMWWSQPVLNHTADLLVPPDLLEEIKDHLNSEGLDYDVIIWDLQKAIMYENPRLSKTQRVELEQQRGHPLTWRRYHRYADIVRYMEFLSLKYPDIVELIALGRSAEGMPLMAAKVSYPRDESEEEPWDRKKKFRLKSKMKPAVWLDGGMHAREWISPAVATWILHSLVEGENGEGADMEMLKMADWYIMPLANPDGYEYTHTKDRLWRKTRTKHFKEISYYNSWFPWTWGGRTECVGVDPNRNWDYHWGEKGASKDPCSEYYAGPFAFSEPEIKAIANFIMQNKDQMKLYLSLHSYAQMWLMPSTHTKQPFSDKAEIAEMGKLAVDALAEVYGTKYEVGSMSDFKYPITGTSHDWAKSMAGIKYAYNVKMRDSYGPYGFLLPGSQIAPTAKETWEAIKAIVDNL